MLKIPGIDEKYNGALNSALEKLIKRPNIIGIILFGSIAKGRAHSFSDIDMYVVGEEEKDRTERFLIEDIPIQVQWRSVSDFIRKLANPKRVKPVLCEGIIIYDPDNFLKKYVKLSKEIFKKGPEPLNVRERTLLRAKLSDGLFEINGLIANNKNEAVQLVMDELLFETLIGYYELNCWWRVSRKNIFDDLLKKDEDMASKVRNYLFTYDISQRKEMLQEIVNTVLSIAGGELKEYILIWKDK